MTEFLEVEGGRIAYDVTGDGPLVVLLPGMGIRRDFYSSLARQLVRQATGWPRGSARARGVQHRLVLLHPHRYRSDSRDRSR